MKPRYILFSLFVLTSIMLSAQNSFFEDDPAFAVKSDTSVSHSVVILAQRTEMTYVLTANKPTYAEKFRRRIFLYDKAAVAAFSEYYFFAPLNRKWSLTDMQTDYGLSIRILKKDGAEISVNIDAAVPIEGDNVPVFFKGRRRSAAFIYYKIAVPGLEPGDLVDISERKTEYYPSAGNMVFPGYYVVMNTMYPIRYQHFNLQYDPKFSVVTASYNGCLPLGEPKDATVKIGRSTIVKVKQLTLTDKNRAAVRDERWQSTQSDQPYLKFQVYKIKTLNPYKTGFWCGVPGSVLRSVDPENIALAISKKINDPSLAVESEARFLSSGGIKYLPAGVSYSEKVDRDLMEKISKRCDKLYIGFRDKMCYSRMDENPWQNEKQISDLDFVTGMSIMLNNSKIPFEIVVTSVKDGGGANSVLFDDDIRLAILVGEKLYYPFSLHTAPGEEGKERFAAKAFAFKPGKNARLLELHPYTISFAPKENNIMLAQVDLKLDASEDPTEINIRTAYLGLFKRDYSFNSLKSEQINQETFFSAGQQTVPREPGRISSHDDKLRYYGALEYNRQREEYLKMLNRATNQEREAEIKQDFLLKDYLEYNVQNKGRDKASDSLCVSDKFTARALLTPFNKHDYIFDAGSLIGGQLELKSDEKNRQSPAHFNYPRTIVDKIRVTIPEGYELSGIENLNVSVVNSIGEFTAAAKTEGNLLTIDVKKEYIKTDISVSEWPQFIEFADAAWSYGEKRVLLVKKK